MEVTEFTDSVYPILKKLRRDLASSQKNFSDVTDDRHQYVDIVMEGGGVLGIALVGFTYVLEEMGIRFLRIGGASAGAINAIFLAALGKPDEAKSERVVELLANVDLYEFIDGDKGAKRLVDAWMAEAGRVRLGFLATRIWDNVRDDLGLNPGTAFYKWVKDTLQSYDITTTSNLKDRMKSLPEGLKHRDGTPYTYDVERALAIVAADVSTETKVVFPRMASLYWEDSESVNPAEYVRASMSIPFFFHPYRVSNVPQGKKAMDRWHDLADYDETPPEVCTFIDGGIMSNFPIDLFHRPDRVPSVPTFGVKVGTDKRKRSRIEMPTQLLGAIFDSARHCLDYDFVARNPDYKHLVTCIDTGDHDWLNFRMGDENMVDLFSRGARAAANFLRGFDWEGYKKIREGLAVAYLASEHQHEIKQA